MDIYDKWNVFQGLLGVPRLCNVLRKKCANRIPGFILSLRCSELTAIFNPEKARERDPDTFFSFLSGHRTLCCTRNSRLGMTSRKLVLVPARITGNLFSRWERKREKRESKIERGMNVIMPLAFKLLKKAGHLMVDSDDDPDYELAVDYSVRTGILGGGH